MNHLTDQGQGIDRDGPMMCNTCVVIFDATPTYPSNSQALLFYPILALKATKIQTPAHLV